MPYIQFISNGNKPTRKDETMQKTPHYTVLWDYSNGGNGDASFENLAEAKRYFEQQIDDAAQHRIVIVELLDNRDGFKRLDLWENEAKGSYTPALRHSGWTGFRGAPEATLKDAMAAAERLAAANPGSRSNPNSGKAWCLTVFRADGLVAASRIEGSSEEWSQHKKLTKEELNAIAEEVEAVTGREWPRR